MTNKEGNNERLQRQKKLFEQFNERQNYQEEEEIIKILIHSRRTLFLVIVLMFKVFLFIIYDVIDKLIGIILLMIIYFIYVI